jgi:hypothetical protein
MKNTTTKNEFMTFRDPGHQIRDLIDELRLMESGGKTIPPDRTAMIKLCLERCRKAKKREMAKG